jgi:hypothetical protein
MEARREHIGPLPFVLYPSETQRRAEQWQAFLQKETWVLFPRHYIHAVNKATLLVIRQNINMYIYRQKTSNSTEHHISWNSFFPATLGGVAVLSPLSL